MKSSRKTLQNHRLSSACECIDIVELKVDIKSLIKLSNSWLEFDETWVRLKQTKLSNAQHTLT
jgi:hypothetical protein